MRLASHSDMLRVLRLAARAQVIDIGTYKERRREPSSETNMLPHNLNTVWMFSRRYAKRKGRICDTFVRAINEGRKHPSHLRKSHKRFLRGF
jgi:hypothetical protein